MENKQNFMWVVPNSQSLGQEALNKLKASLESQLQSQSVSGSIGGGSIGGGGGLGDQATGSAGLGQSQAGTYTPPVSHDCPHCGRCPSCGRGGYYPYCPPPWWLNYPDPYIGDLPNWGTVTCGPNSQLQTRMYQGGQNQNFS